MFRLLRAIVLMVSGVTLAVHADNITLTGTITQSQNDQPGNPAVNNPSLNNINDGNSYSATLNFTGSILLPGSYSLTGALFSDPTGPATENGFTSGTIVISQSSGVDTFSVQACLTGFTCNTGNELDLNFTIAASGLNGTISQRNRFPDCCRSTFWKIAAAPTSTHQSPTTHTSPPFPSLAHCYYWHRGWLWSEPEIGGPKDKSRFSNH
jgi:hypothetical protein